ncbi:hypothetical protein LJC34_06245 [Oscillospiraceae bacterium OttesenSCG-928-G22]|nr:hypothetical protein [Oscillospiraceae bacterium OttesenSCG-928-G22]
MPYVLQNAADIDAIIMPDMSQAFRNYESYAKMASFFSHHHIQLMFSKASSQNFVEREEIVL